jgi:hypothetical protein
MQSYQISPILANIADFVLQAIKAEKITAKSSQAAIA